MNGFKTEELVKMGELANRLSKQKRINPRYQGNYRVLGSACIALADLQVRGLPELQPEPKKAHPKPKPKAK
jgi:hypothetical protein